MNEQALQPYIESYKTIIAEGNPGERYKWEALVNFQDTWDIEASDFGAMFDSSFQAVSENLWVSSRYYPKKMMLEFIALDQELVRSMFRELYDEDQDIRLRVEAFALQCDTLLGRWMEEGERSERDLSHYHGDMRAVSQYLFFRYPEKYYLYKYTEVNRFFAKFRSAKVMKYAKSIDRYLAFLDQFPEVRSILLSDGALVDIYDKWIATNALLDPNNTLMTFDFVFQTAIAIKPSEAAASVEGSEPTGERVWLYSPGNQATHWDEFLQEGIMAVGWDELGDLREYASQEEIVQRFSESQENLRNSPIMQAKACFDFVHEMQVGDIVYAKKGRGTIIGKGTITGEYEYDDSRAYYKQVRTVAWERNGEWQVPEERKLNTKHLTEITQYPRFLKEIEASLSDSPSHSSPTSFWWLNANPRIWDIASPQVGELQTYTSHNEKGNKRRVYQYFTQIQEGDLLIGYASTPTKQVVALYKATKALHISDDEGEIIEIEKIENLVVPIPYKTLQALPELKRCEPFVNNQGSLFKLSEDEYDFIKEIIDENQPSIPEIQTEYTLQECSQDTGIELSVLEDWCSAIDRKGQAIIYGPPGTGKTFMAEHLARHLVGGGNGFYELVQFHPAYAYEDFVQGIRPEVDGDGTPVFALKPGRFVSFCTKASRTQDTCVLIIDEINRANLARVFGELMYLLEYRDKKVHLANGEGNQFSIPAHVRIIGTMNTADRSIALVDFALRRRFAFIELAPDYDLLKKHPEYTQGVNVPNLIRILEEINRKINDKSFSLGVSFFLLKDLQKHIGQIWRMEIETYLEEYFFTQAAVMKDYRWAAVKAQILA
ncbi:MAG: AAA family ATPase [Sphaerochaeta sp.]|nr:AAA family ATPase [Sphaerochaeta sp.]